MPFQSDLRSACFIAMAPKQAKKGKKPLSLPTAPPSFEPALGWPRVLNNEAMDKVRPMLASSFNEGGELELDWRRRLELDEKGRTGGARMAKRE